MRQYTRFYIDKDNNVLHVHTNTRPFSFEPVEEDKNVIQKIDVELDIPGTGFINAKEIRGDAGIDKNRSPVFTSHKKLCAATKRVVRSERVKQHEDTL